LAGELFHNGARKYLTADERERFLRAAEEHPRAVRTLCAVLAFSGCRISEATALTVDRVDLNTGTLVFESLKKRRRGVFRAVPVPPSLLKDLDNVHGVRELQGRGDRGAGVRLWNWSRITAWRNVCGVMAAILIMGEQACSSLPVLTAEPREWG
jgi:integrase/recombinase XerD